MNPTEIRKRIVWKDLVKLSKKEVFIENTITIPWLIGSLLLAGFGYYFWAIPFSVIFFLTALRQVHNGFHNSLGLSKSQNWWVLYGMSVLMLSSIHAVQFNHLRHHKYCMGEEDFEGRSGRMSALGAILYGPLHIFHIHRLALKLGNQNYRKNTLLELLSIGGFISISFYFEIYWLMYHCIVMLAGEFMSAFFAVWTVHHHTEKHPDLPRTQRKSWKNKITFNMFYHLEHHLFPAVPTIKLPELARRLDEAIPDLEKKTTF